MTGRTGLHRFVRPPDAPSRSARPAVLPTASPDPAGPAAPEPERCEMCGSPAGPDHGHVVDSENRSLQCACRACYLLFTRPDAGGGRFRAVPRRYLSDPDRPLTTAEWEGLGIPVGSVFFLRTADGVAAFYPSPAGATECLLDLDAWAAIGAEHPMLAAAEPDVEAILVHSTGKVVDCYLVPIDVCYELVGVVRMYWQGFDGGPEARERIDEFLGRIASAARPFTAEG